MNNASRTIKVFLVPALVTGYMILFWRSTSGMPLGGQGVPRLLIGVIALLLVAVLVRDVALLRRSDSSSGHTASPEQEPVPFDADSAGGELLMPAEFEGDIQTRESFTQTDVPPAPVRSTSVRPPIAIVVSLLLYWLLLTRIGAYPSTALFVIGLSLTLGYRKPVMIVLATIACVVIVYSFVRIFTLPLPGFAWF